MSKGYTYFTISTVFMWLVERQDSDASDELDAFGILMDGWWDRGLLG